MKRINAITFLNNFVSGALTLLIPLILLDRNVDLAEIGIVLSALPLVFLVARLIFAAVADRVGWSHIFLLINWPTTVVASAIYYFANSSFGFFAGKVVEGLRESSYWAVNRTAILGLSPKKMEMEATRTNAVVWLATAIGSAAAGAGIAYVGFSPTLLLMVLVSGALVFPAALLWKVGKSNLKPMTKSFARSLSPFGKGKSFWYVSVALMFCSFAVYPLTALLLPVFMDQELNYSYLTIGLLFMVYNLLASGVTLLSLKIALTRKRVFIQSAVGLGATLFLANSGFLFPAVICALAFARGFSVAYFEHSVAKVAKQSKNVSVDIGFLHVPMRIAEFASVLAAGFLVQEVGYAPVFAATGVAFVVFSVMAHRTLKEE